MWKLIEQYFNAYPTQEKIAQKMLAYGLKVHDNTIYCGEIALSASKIAKALSVDRRAVTATIQTIMRNPDLLTIFSNLLPTCHLKEVAPHMHWGVIEIIPTDPSTPGILAEVATIIAQHHISIRQAIGDDFEFTEEPRLFIITETPIPGAVIPQIRQAKGVKAVLIY